VTTAEEYRLLGFADADREAAEAFTPDAAVVKDLADQIRAAIGKLGSEPEFRMPEDPRNSVQAFLDTVPDIRAYHSGRGIPDDISWASLADLGQQLKVSRRTHGEYSLETHWWLTNFWVGNLYTLGRLQSELEDLAVGGLRAAGPERLPVLKTLRDDLGRAGASAIATRLDTLVEAIRDDRRDAGAALMRAQAGVRLFERLLTLDVAAARLAVLASEGTDAP